MNKLKKIIMYGYIFLFGWLYPFYSKESGINIKNTIMGILLCIVTLILIGNDDEAK